MNSKTKSTLLLVLLTITLIICSTLVLTILANKSEENITYAEWTGQGTGTAADPYLIGTKAELEKFRNIVNGTGETQNTSACARLIADINLEGSNSNRWTPIGEVVAVVNEDKLYAMPTDTGNYLGTFDGNGHTISGLYVKKLSDGPEDVKGYTGLFGAIGTTGKVKNLTVSGTSLAHIKAGGIAAANKGIIELCTSNVSIVSDNEHSGGIAATTSETSIISKCVNKGSINANSYAGGLVGYNQGLIENSYNIGSISSDEGCNGGISADNTSSSIVRYCHNQSKVKQDEGGGIASYNDDGNSIVNCYCKDNSPYSIEAGSITTNRLSAAQFKDKANFTNWDFENTWEMGANYPILRNSADKKVIKFDTISFNGAEEYANQSNVTTSYSKTIEDNALKFTIANNSSVTFSIALTTYYDFHFANINLKSQGSGIKVSYEYNECEYKEGEILADNEYQDFPIYFSKGSGSYKSLTIKFKNESGESRDLYIKSIDTYWIGNPYVITIVAEGATDPGAGKFYAAYGLGYFRDAQLTERVESGYGTDGVYVQMPKKTGYRLINTCTQLNDGDAILGTNGSLMNAVSGNYRYFTGDSNVYAYFQIHTGPVYLYPNGGAFADNEERHKLGDGNIDWGTTLPTVTDLPTKDGYDFDGFYDAETGGTQYIGADGVCVKTWDKERGGWSTNLYAQYTAQGAQTKVDPQTPTGIEAAYGQTLDKVALPKDWAWVDGTQEVGTFGEHTFKANYTPTGDDANVYKAKSNVDITVNVKWILVDPTQSEVKVTIKDGDDSYDINITIKVEVETKIQEKQNEYNITLGKNENIAGIYGVKLLRKTIVGGQEIFEEIQPSDIKDGAKIQATMAIPESAKGQNFKVLHIHSAEDIQEIAYTLSADGNYITIETDKLSDFAFVVDAKPSHGFCVGWVVFTFMILELLATAVYVIVRYHLLDEIVKKCKLECLFEKVDLMTLIGLCVSGALFLCALIILCCHICAISIISFVLALLICLAFTYFFLNDKGIIDKLLKKQPKVEEEVKEEPVQEEKQEETAENVEAAAEAEIESEKEETIEAIEAKEAAHEALTLKDSLVLAKATTSSHTFSKKYVADYLRTKDIVEVNERENYTKTGLPLADTHYVDGKDGKKCFAYVYETEGSIILLAKMNDDYAQKLQEKHSQINKSAFPKQKNTWYSLIIDDTYTKEEFEGILDELIGEVKEDAGVSLKESIALAKASTAHSFTKAYVCEYLKDRKEVELNTRENCTKTGLPLADTHYVEKDGKKICFAYVYEIEGTMILLAKMNTQYANELKKKHPQVNLSAFPKQKDTWYSLIIDDTYTKEEFEKILDDISK